MQERVIFSYSRYKSVGWIKEKVLDQLQWMLPAISRIIMAREKNKPTFATHNQWENQLFTVFGQVSSKHIDWRNEQIEERKKKINSYH